MKRIICFLLVALLVIRPDLTSYADENEQNPVISTPSDAVDNNFFMLSDVRASSVPNVNNTFNLTRGIMKLEYKNASGSTLYSTFNYSNTASYPRYFTLGRPSDFQSPRSIYYNIDGSDLPVSGLYRVRAKINPNTGITFSPNSSYNSIGLAYAEINIPGTANSNYIYGFGFHFTDSTSSGPSRPIINTYTSEGTPTVQQVIFSSAGEYYIDFGVVEIDKNPYKRLQLVFPITELSFSSGFSFSLSFATGNYDKSDISFSMIRPNLPALPPGEENSAKLDNINDSISDVKSSVDDVKSAVDGMSSSLGSKLTDMISGITNLPGNMASAFQDHFDNVLTQLHYITDQLQALWDQLAAYFNDKLIPQMITDTNRIVEAIENVDHQVNVDLTALKEQLAQQHQQQIANDNQNTDKIVNGYENSDMDTVTGGMSSSIDSYDTVEEQLFGQVHGYLTGFNFNPNLISGYVQSITLISTIMTGFFNIDLIGIPLQLALTLTVALLLIGWYRFKSGG